MPHSPTHVTLSVETHIVMSLFSLLIPLFLAQCCLSTDTISIPIPHNLSVQIPSLPQPGFVARAYFIWSHRTTPSFKAAVAVESTGAAYSCSLQLFLSDVTVWSSAHYSPFLTSHSCVLHLSPDGDLQLTGLNGQIGWRTATSGQGVRKLQILHTGNLVLLDNLNTIKWQTFNFPTDVILWGQRLDVATRLTTLHTNSTSTSFYSFEIQRDRVALFLNSGGWRYSYWEFKPSNNRNITFLKLGSNGLELFSDQYKKIAQIPSQNPNPLRFLSLEKERGNLGLYFYSPENKNFQVSFQALNATCDLPLACKPYNICTSKSTCSCIRCGKAAPGGLCGEGEAEMVELEDVGSVLRGAPKMGSNISKEECAGLCVDDCECASALYEGGECYVYGVVVGVREVRGGSGMSYFVKVRKGSGGSDVDVKKWVVVVVVVVDAFVVVIVLGGLWYYLIHRREKNLSPVNNAVESTSN